MGCRLCKYCIASATCVHACEAHSFRPGRTGTLCLLLPVRSLPLLDPCLAVALLELRVLQKRVKADQQRVKHGVGGYQLAR